MQNDSKMQYKLLVVEQKQRLRCTTCIRFFPGCRQSISIITDSRKVGLWYPLLSSKCAPSEALFSFRLTDTFIYTIVNTSAFEEFSNKAINSFLNQMDTLLDEFYY